MDFKPPPEILERKEGVAWWLDATGAGGGVPPGGLIGWVPSDPAVPRSVTRQTPVVLAEPYSPAARAIARIQDRTCPRSESYLPARYCSTNRMSVS